VRLECQQLYTENIRLKEEWDSLKTMANPRKYLELQQVVYFLGEQSQVHDQSKEIP
jgi:hypothetical protein